MEYNRSIRRGKMLYVCGVLGDIFLFIFVLVKIDDSEGEDGRS